MIQTKKYSFSFTAGNALIAETLVVANAYLEHQDWATVKSVVEADNSLKKIKQSTFQREFQEISKRLMNLTDAQLKLLVSGDSSERQQMIFLALLKTYAFFRDFVVEVVRYKVLMFDYELKSSDYTQFVVSKAMIHCELDNLSESTAKKIKQVSFRLLEQTGLIGNVKTPMIIRPILSDRCLNVILGDNPSLLTGFLFSEKEIKAKMESSKL